MATKLQRITQLSYDSTKELSSQSKWTDFLNSAAWHYKYPFEDQVLIYAQRPDATACADFDTWSTKLNRRINRGAKGIALLREQGNEYFLDHVFDISDTTPRTRNASIRLWEYNEKYDDAIIETLENTFGELKITTKLTDAIICAAHNAVEDNKADYLSELRYTKGDSFLADLDELNVDVEFQKTAEASVAYMIMQRMGLHPEEVFDNEEFRHIIDFNTIETMSVLGNAVSEISEQALREISSTIVAEAKKEQQQAKIFAENKNVEYNNVKEETQPQIHTERNDINDRGNLQERERDSDTELGSTEERTSDRQIRNDEEEISQAEQTEPLFSNDDSRNIDEPSSRNRQNSEGTGRGNGTEDGEIGGRDGETESGESAEVDRLDEQPQTFRRRSSPQTVSSQLSLFDLIEDEDVAVSMAREVERLNNIRPAFSISQEIIDKVLSDGTNEKESLLMISAEFSKNKPLADKVEFLKDHYGIDGKGFIFDGRKVTAWWNKDGMKISYGSSIRDNFTQELSWEDVARRIDELLDIGRFAPSNILLQIDDYIYTKTAQNFWYMYRDLNYDDYPELRELFTDKAFERKGGFPEDVKRLKEFLKTSAGLDMTKTAVQKVCDMRDEGKDVTRFWYINPHETNKMLEDLYIVRKQYTSQSLSYVPPARFITEDEIDNIFRGGTGMQDGRYRVYNYFAEHPDKQERIAFLKKEYGTGGSYNGKRNEDHDGKGIRFSRGQLGNPVAEVHIKWNEAEKRIDKLIKQGRYLTQKDIINIPDYERHEVASSIYYAFQNRIQDGQYRPYPSDMDYYGDAMKAIAEKIKLPEQMEEIFEEINIALSETPHDDRNYKWRIEARDTLEKYMEGNFNLFPGIDRPAPNSVKDLKEAMRVINEYSKEEFEGDETDFSDLTSVSLAFTETEDGKHYIDVEADLINHKIIRSIDNQLVEEHKYGSLSELTEKELYQRNSVAIQGYEDTTLPDSFFDVAIGNVPFGYYKLSDKKYNKHNFLIHDYFFAKTLDKVRPGGNLRKR